MKETLPRLETKPFPLEREWTVDGVPVLRLTGSLPQPVGKPSRTLRRIQRFYQHQARCYLRYCQRFLLPLAEEAYRTALASSAPLPLYTAELSYEVTCSRGGIWSLHTDSRQRCGGQTEVLRRGDTWDLRTGYPIPLSDCFPRRSPLRKTILAAAAAEIRRRGDAEAVPWREDWQLRLRRSFNRENFFLTEEGLRVFWPMYALAPGELGCPDFLLPYGEGGCRFPGEEAPSGTPEEAAQSGAD